MATKAELIESALRIGKEEELKYVGCGQSTFSGICKTFSDAGMPLMEKEIEDKIFKGMIGLMAGCGLSARGSCGACSAASFMVSWTLDKGREDNQENILEVVALTGEHVKKKIVDKFGEDYGSCVCRDIQFSKFGKATDFLSDNTLFVEFLRNTETCDLCTQENCTIAKGVAWAVEEICNIKGIH